MVYFLLFIFIYLSNSQNLINTQNTIKKENLINTQNTIKKENLINTQNTIKKQNLINTQNTIKKENLINTQNTIKKQNLINTQNTIKKEILPDNFKPSLPIGKAYNVKGHRNPDLLSFKTPIEKKLINHEMKLRGLNKGIRILKKNIKTHKEKISKSETKKEVNKHNKLIAKNINSISQLKAMEETEKLKMKSTINSIPPQIKPVIIKKLRLEHRL